MSLDYLSHDTPRGPLPYLYGAPARPSANAPLLVFLHGGRDRGDDLNLLPVSYTHLTLPTICSV